MRTTQSGGPAATSATRRGLGPFSGGQLTVIVVTAIVALALPIGAYATITGSNAFITDHTTGAHASVQSTGELLTTSVPPIGGVEFTVERNPTVKTCTTFTVPTGSALVVTSVTFEPAGATVGSDATLSVELFHTTCLSPGPIVATGRYSADGAYEQQFTPGVGIESGSRLWLNLGGSALTSSFATVRGYYVPAGFCFKGEAIICLL
jgi:hypothetical protein